MFNDSEESKFTAKNWYVRLQKVNTTKIILLNLRQKLLNHDYSDAFILVTGDITVTASNGTHVAFKNCAPFSTCKKLMICLLMKQTIFTLQCLCII